MESKLPKEKLSSDEEAISSTRRLEIHRTFLPYSMDSFEISIQKASETPMP
jgi:hypothetical protein